MLPYNGLTYFALILVIALPAVFLGLRGRRILPWILLASVVMLVVHVGNQRTSLDGTSVNVLWIATGYVLLQWAAARGLLHFRTRRATPFGFALALVVALAPLVIVKLMAVYDPTRGLGFLGISYLSFRVLDVLLGINDRLITVLSPAAYFSYLLFFPTASAGPIDRYRRFLGDVSAPRSRPQFLKDIDEGVALLFRGLLYKFMLAAVIETRWLEPASGGRTLASIVSYTYAYSAYLFFDFAGYSALAIGTARFFGVRVPPNFDRPFLAGNIVDFWNRWHISLSTWFRDHIYMRIVLVATKKRWFQSRYTASYLAFAVSFVLMGLWHGFRIYLLLYGAYHAMLLIGHSLVNRWARGRPALVGSAGWRLLGWLVTFNAVCFGFLIFSGHLGNKPSAGPSVAQSTARTETVVQMGPVAPIARRAVSVTATPPAPIPARTRRRARAAGLAHGRSW
jgi:membrane protein involved in D-alanine export